MVQTRTSVQISGRVIRGEGYGRVLGFPTANIDRREFLRRKLRIRFGIWAGWTEILNLKSEILHRYRAAIVIGPLDKKGLPKLEAHLIGFKGSLYGKYLRLILVKYIRGYRTFKDEAALKEQIKKDIQRATVLSKN